MADAPEPSSSETVTPTAAAQEKRRSKSFTTFLLAATLSGILLVLWVGYLIFAPTPHATVSTTAQVQPADAAAANTLRVLAPRHLIGPDLLADFQTESGLTIDLILYDDDEELGGDANVAIASDVMLVSGAVFQRLKAQDRLAVLPARQIGNLGLIDPALRTLAATYDKGALHSIPLAWTTFGLGLNREAVGAVLGPAAPIDTWALLFDPQFASKLATCGVHSIASPSAAFPVALKYLGVVMQSDAPADTERASALWEATRASIAALDTKTVRTALAEGTACAAFASAADVYQARAAARDAAKTFTLQFVQPREGTLLRVYMLGLSRFSKNQARAAALMNYLIRPDIAARLTNSRWVANAVPASQLYVRQDIKDDALIYPSVGAFRTLTPEANPSAATVSLRERFWQLMSAAPKPP
jgi:spermidine/putrescine-binding protein